jgi:hypothetical protein
MGPAGLLDNEVDDAVAREGCAATTRRSIPSASERFPTALTGTARQHGEDEFLVVTLFDSLAAERAFAGADYEVPVSLVAIATAVVSLFLALRADRRQARAELREQREEDAASARRSGRPIVVPRGGSGGPAADRVRHDYMVRNGGEDGAVADSEGEHVGRPGSSRRLTCSQRPNPASTSLAAAFSRPPSVSPAYTWAVTRAFA